LLDDMTFTPNGSPGQLVERQGRYSSAWLLRRDMTRQRMNVDVSVIVYANRSIDRASEERAYLGCQPDPSTATTIYIPYGAQQKPAIRKGGWILDATVPTDLIPQTGQVDASTLKLPQGFFYRVVNVNDSVPGQLTLELQTPLRPLYAKNASVRAGSDVRTIVVMDLVAEVFEKGPIDLDMPMRMY